MPLARNPQHETFSNLHEVTTANYQTQPGPSGAYHPRPHVSVRGSCSPHISHDPVEPDLKNILTGPTWSHPFGTDTLGRDVLSRVMYGSRISLLVGFVSVGIATLIGIMVGAVSGYSGGIIDELIMRFVDLMMCFPTFFLILAVIALLEPSIWNIMIVIGLTNWMGIARLVRAEILSIKGKEYVLAAKAMGFPRRRIIFGHVLPNALSPVYVVARLALAVQSSQSQL